MHSKSLSDSLFAKYCYVHFEALSARRNKVSKDNREGQQAIINSLPMKKYLGSLGKNGSCSKKNFSKVFFNRCVAKPASKKSKSMSKPKVMTINLLRRLNLIARR